MSLDIQFRTVGLEQALKDLKNFSGDINTHLRQIMLRVGAEGEQKLKLSMKDGGNLGRIGPRGGRIRVHSKPGEAPYVQLGNLRASLGYNLVSMPGEHAVELGAIRRGKGGVEVPYARKLEEEMNRPYLMPVAMELWANLPTLISKVFRRLRA